MSSVNKVILIGNLGKDPEFKTFDGDKQKASFSLATSEKYSDRTITKWHNIVVWGKLAKVCKDYLRKGSPVAIIGKITYREYEKEGEKKYITEIVSDEMQMLGKAPESKPKVKVSDGIPGTDDFPENDLPW